jgi:hypothetical protein
MNTLTTCPMCHEKLQEPVDKDLIDAKTFCPWCDYPLFWTVAPSVTAPAGTGLDASPAVAMPSTVVQDKAWLRQPGVGGRDSNTGEDCWYCGEPNDADATECWRCHKEIPQAEDPPIIRQPVPPGAKFADVVLKRNPLVPAWLLVTLGVVLIALTIVFIVAAI